jgi:hypothetical protein
VEANFHFLSMSHNSESSNGLSEQISAEHVEAIKVLWQKSSTISPSRVQNHHALLDAQGNKRYLEKAIQQVLEKLSIESTRNRPTAENRAAKQAHQALHEPDPPKQRPMTKQMDHSGEVGFHQVRVEHEDAYMKLNISSTLNLDQFKLQLRSKFELEPDTRVLLGQQTADGWSIIGSEEAWAQALMSDNNTFQIRLRTSESSSRSNSSASEAGTIRSVHQPQRLAFDNDEPGRDTSGRLQVQKQWEYENKLSQHVRNRVTDKLEKEGDTVGTADVTKSIAGLLSLLRVCNQLADEWAVLNAEQQSRADGISVQQLLTWYIGAVINKFHPTISQAWQSNDPSTRAKRNPAAFDSFDSFLAQVYLTVKPGVSGAPTTILPAMLTDLQGRFMTFKHRREICGEIRQMLSAAQFLQDHLFSGSSGDLTMTIKVFLENTLSGDVQTALVEILKQHHSEDLPPIFRDSDDYAQLQAYNLESVLRRWSALDTRKGPLTPEEFKGPQPRLPRVNSGRDSVNNQRITPTAALPALSSKEFYVTVDGQSQPITFRQNLASWTDQQDRAREEHKFLEAVYNFDGNGKYCNRPGHQAVGCPDKFKLARISILNPTSSRWCLREWRWTHPYPSDVVA